jgi:DNA-binding transcriptional LysR family regulator
MLDWNDLRFFLAVARSGSTLAAGRALKVSQTTAARRVAALEAALGLTLFERRQAGYALTPSGEALLAQAEAVESAAGALADAAAAEVRGASGVVRLTAIDLYAGTVIPPLLRDLHDEQPAIRIELDISDDPRDLAAGEADLALRGGKPGTSGGLVARRIAHDPWTIYCSRDYAARHFRPEGVADLRSHPIIGGGGPYVGPVYRQWIARRGLTEAVAMEPGNAAGLLAAVRAGFGMAVLPTFLADREPDLVRVLEPSASDDSGLWLVTHERLRHVPRVRVVMDFLAARLSRMARQVPTKPEAVWATESA